MGSRYLTDLATVCRAAGLVVQEESGWQTRARGSGGYQSPAPSHVMIHHTASNPSSDGQADVNYCCYGSPDAPIANLYLSRTGKVWVMAAGATNTNGKGHDSWGGGVPDDSMNTWAIGIEAANRGDSTEAWAPAQEDAYLKLVDALCAAYGIPGNHVREHAEWAPGRKIDPAGPSRWAASGTWPGQAFRDDLGGAPEPPEPPLPPDVEEEPVDYVKVNRNANASVVFRRSGHTLVWLSRQAITAEQNDYAAAGMAKPKEHIVQENVTDFLSGYVLLGPVPDFGGGDYWPPLSAFRGHLKAADPV